MRDPTPAELVEIAKYLQDQCGDQTEPTYGEEIAGRSWIGVADGYISDGPGYTGKVITVIYPAGPETHDVLCYNEDGDLYRVVSEHEACLREELRPKTAQEIHDEDQDITKLLDDLSPPPEGDEWKQQ